MVEDLNKEDIDAAILKSLLEIQIVLRTMAEFQEQLGAAIEMLAEQLGYEFSVKDDARA